MNALANEEVGNYLNSHFVAAYQKVGTFRVMSNGQKMGGNVAAYFALPTGRVLHVVAGPVNAEMLLREARWVIEMRKLALTEAQGNGARYTAFIRDAHLERLRTEHAGNVPPRPAPGGNPAARVPTLVASPLQARVHTLLIQKPRATIEQIYKDVFEKILGERISTLPVMASK